MVHKPSHAEPSKTAEGLRSPVRVQASASVVKVATVGVDDVQAPFA